MLDKEPNALQIRVALAEIEPAIWRRLVVPCTWHLGQLHLCIQAAFNWWNYHLHEFRIGGLRYGDPEVDDMGFVDGPRVFDERQVCLRDFDSEPGTAFTYLYDFGDDWHHTIEIEKVLAFDVTPKTRRLHRRRESQTARGRRRGRRLRTLPRHHGRPGRPGARRDQTLVRRPLRSRMVRPRPHQ